MRWEIHCERFVVGIIECFRDEVKIIAFGVENEV